MNFLQTTLYVYIANAHQSLYIYIYIWSLLKPFNLKKDPYFLILLLCIEQLVNSELLDQLIQ